MSKRDEILQEILSEPEILHKYKIRKEELQMLKSAPPYKIKLIEVLSTIINENDNNRTARQIYPTIKNIHKI